MIHLLFLVVYLSLERAKSLIGRYMNSQVSQMKSNSKLTCIRLIWHFYKENGHLWSSSGLIQSQIATPWAWNSIFDKHLNWFISILSFENSSIIIKDFIEATNPQILCVWSLFITINRFFNRFMESKEILRWLFSKQSI